MERAGRRIEVRGSVQGVGFRPWVWRLAHELGVTGTVRNHSEGVSIEAFGPDDALDALVERMRSSPPPAARIARLVWERVPAVEVDDFTIATSVAEGSRRSSIPADLATCDACLAEVLDPANRRYRYPFTNCTDCGPRFTIALDVPYDRAATTMASFHMCPDCQREYDDPRDRRFHAQPNACPVCGPRLSWLDAEGQPVADVDALDTAVEALRQGRIVAVKGLGGFHLACDATDGHAVRRLRTRKRREEKPFAVMVPTLAAARTIAAIDDAEEALLTGPERPIVLLRRSNGGVAPEVAPDAPRIGVMLPYTPLHHLLLALVGRPLVMTSANRGGEPIAHTTVLAKALLAGIADGFLVHDRDITTRTDDSVATVIGGLSTVLRRSRGFVPRPVAVTVPFPEPVLAVGADLKNAFCIGVGDTAWLGPHVGDLENESTWDALGEAVDRMQRFLGVVPHVVAHDLHPGYLSTRFAMERPARERFAVQHHHAHVASAMAEHGLTRAIGVAYDGTGYGVDGTSWGSEVLIANEGRFRRFATWRPVALAGGDRAMREPWRVAVALLEDAFEEGAPDGLRFWECVDPRALDVARRQRKAGINSPLAHGMGRLFDGVASLALVRPVATYEGQLAMAWEQAAAPGEAMPYRAPIEVEGTGFDALRIVDHRPMVRAIVGDLLDRVPVALIAARFHATVVRVVADLVALAAESHTAPVVLTGGCFQNALLSAGARAALSDRFEVFTHREVPPGDGGVALGQAVVAAARLGWG